MYINYNRYIVILDAYQLTVKPEDTDRLSWPNWQWMTSFVSVKIQIRFNLFSSSNDSGFSLTADVSVSSPPVSTCYLADGYTGRGFRTYSSYRTQTTSRRTAQSPTWSREAAPKGVTSPCLPTAAPSSRFMMPVRLTWMWPSPPRTIAWWDNPSLMPSPWGNAMFFHL